MIDFLIKKEFLMHSSAISAMEYRDAIVCSVQCVHNNLRCTCCSECLERAMPILIPHLHKVTWLSADVPFRRLILMD